MIRIVLRVLIIAIFCIGQSLIYPVQATGEFFSGNEIEQIISELIDTPNTIVQHTQSSISPIQSQPLSGLSGDSSSIHTVIQELLVLGEPPEVLDETSETHDSGSSDTESIQVSGSTFPTGSTRHDSTIVQHVTHTTQNIQRSSISSGTEETTPSDTITKAKDHIKNIIKQEKTLTVSAGTINTNKKVQSNTLNGTINVELPENTQMYYTGSDTPVSMSMVQPQLVSQAPVATQLVAPLETVFWGDSNASIQFRQENIIESVTFTVTSDTLEELTVGEYVYISTSQDGKNRSFHDYREVVHHQGKKAVIFDTTHLTYFNIGKILGDFTINNDTTSTMSTGVTLTMDITGATRMRFGNSVSERDSASREPYTATTGWILTDEGGIKTVYAGFEAADGTQITVEDEIIFIAPTASGAVSSLPVTGGLTLHFDSSASGAFTTTAFGIQQWNDLSGNGYNARQENATANQPDSVLDTDVGNQVVEFNGSSDFLSIETLNYNNTTSLGGILVCTVFKSSFNTASYNGNRAFLDYDRSEFFNFYLEGDGDIGFSYAASAGGITDNSGNGIFNDGDWHVSCASFDGSATNDTILTADGAILYEQNRVANGVVLSDTTTRYGFIGDGSEAGSYNAGRNSIYYDGRIGEIVYYEQAHNETDRRAIECYLGNKRGIAMVGCNDDSPPIATVHYSPETSTNGSVSAVLTGLSESITVTNNDGVGAYLFTGNGEFTFEFEDVAGNTGSVTATVGRIQGTQSTENQPPIITSNGSGDTVTITVASGQTLITTITALDDQRNVIGEYGQRTLVGNTPQTVTHHEICEPVVVVSHRQEVDEETQRSPRVTNKIGTGFDVKVDNYQSNLAGTNSTPIDWIVVASGSHVFDGVITQAGSSSTSAVACSAGGNYNGTEVSFDPVFQQPPVVFHTVSSNTDSSRVFSQVNGNDGTRQSEPTTSEMSTVLHRSFDSCTHGPETIDRIAFEPNHSRLGGGFTLDAVRSDDTVECCTGPGYPVDYYQSFASAPSVVLTAQLGEDGGNGGYAMIDEGGTLSNTTVAVSIDEDGPLADRGHTTEVVSLVAFDQPSGLFFEDNIITYTLSGGADSGHVTLDPITGILSFTTLKNPTSPDDQNNDGIYEVIVAACDSHCTRQCDTQTLSIDINAREVCIESAPSYLYSGVVTTESTTQTLEQQFSGHFSVSDTRGDDIGWYTTLEISQLSGVTYGDSINTNQIQRYATGVELLTGDSNTDVQLASGRSSYRIATGLITFIERATGPNSSRKGSYGVRPFLRFDIPAYIRPDSYRGEICYTLYEN